MVFFGVMVVCSLCLVRANAAGWVFRRDRWVESRVLHTPFYPHGVQPVPVPDHEASDGRESRPDRQACPPEDGGAGENTTSVPGVESEGPRPVVLHQVRPGEYPARATCT